MNTIVVEVKFRMFETRKTKTVKVPLEFPNAAAPCFAELVDEIYRSYDPNLTELFGTGYIIGVKRILD